MILFDEEDGLDDTPMFKQRADEMEASAKRLKDRCAALLAGAKKYRDGITTMLDATNAFTAALADFGGGSDEESLHLGSAVMSQFIKVFRELAGFYDFLRTQLDLGMIERVQKDWMEGVLAAARDERRKYDRKASDYESARVRHQSLKKLTKREVLEKSHADLATARCGEEEARFELARKLTEVELSKRYSFLELVVGAVHAHLMFFRNGTDLLGRLESPINDALQIGEHLRAEKVLRERGLEDMIRGRKEAADRREALIAREVAALEPVPGSGAPGAGASLDGGAAGNGGPGPASGGSVVLSAGPGGPVQMSSANAELSADIERLIRTTRSTSGQQVSIIKQGYLCKRSQGKGRSDFKRRFFVLDSNGMMYYYSHK
ncbi:ADP-ribosylation factor GTPase-activating protein AGD4, partial [Monoraphidium neglectum]